MITNVTKCWVINSIENKKKFWDKKKAAKKYLTLLKRKMKRNFILAANQEQNITKKCDAKGVFYVEIWIILWICFVLSFRQLVVFNNCMHLHCQITPTRRKCNECIHVKPVLSLVYIDTKKNPTNPSNKRNKKSVSLFKINSHFSNDCCFVNVL